MLLFLLAVLPIVFLIFTLGILKMTGYKACILAMILTILEVVFIFEAPVLNVVTGIIEGVVMALWPICLVIVAAVFTYNLVVYTKEIEVIKAMLASVSRDKRILILIIAWGFGAFMEGMAGFGTAVAIPASILVGLGFNPFFAATVCLVANTTPVTFGSIGVPEMTAATITGLNISTMALYTIFQTMIMSILVPFMIVYMVGRCTKNKIFDTYKDIWLIILASGIFFIVGEYFTTVLINSELSSVIGAIISMIAIIILTKLLKVNNSKFNIETSQKNIDVSLKQAFIAWSPFIFVLIFLIFTSSLIPIVNQTLGKFKTSIVIYSGKDAMPYTFFWLSTPGIQIIIATIFGGIVQKCSLKEIINIFIKTVKQLAKTIVTIISVIVTAKLMGYCGMIEIIADFIVNITGNFYPFMAAFLGSIGTFVTGSATSSAVLFAKLQCSAATTLNIDPTWLVAANITGSTAGKIISPQSITIATAAAGIAGVESKILLKVIKYYAVFVVVYGIVTYLGIKIF